MQELFLSILNMSVTACYVIAAVLLVRLLLKKAPKKYSYLLWSVAGFRLLCPVSLSSVVSIFNAGVFNMTKAQSAGNAALHYIPSDIGHMVTPEITVGIPAANTLISEGLPAAAEASGVNSIQSWVLVGSIVWLAGLTVLLICSLVSYLKLKKRTAAAVILTDGVFEADNIRSPFVLGFLRPKIFIPFGLTEREKTYILHHERCHIKRRDPFIKLAAFLILCIHWFNPLVWLAFILMTKDMEMSCDEKVLSLAEDEIKAEYSASLLSFAVNRRFPGASPLAFGESLVKGRIKNILRFKKPRVWISFLSAVLCLAVIVSCAVNPNGNAEQAENVIESSQGVPTDTIPEAAPDASQETLTPITAQPYGIYAFEKNVYANPVSSFLYAKENMPTYILSEDFFMTLDRGGILTIRPVVYEETIVDETSFNAHFDDIAQSFNMPDISEYSQCIQFTLYEGGSSNRMHRLFHMDDEVWLADGGNRIWHIYKLIEIDASSVDLDGIQSCIYRNLGLAVPLPLDYTNRVMLSGGWLDTDVVMEAHYSRGGLLFRIVRHTTDAFDDYRAACEEAGTDAVHFAKDLNYIYSYEYSNDAACSPEYASEYDALLAELESFIIPGIFRENDLTAVNKEL